MARRGRTPLQSKESILDAALASFASLGYDATSVRALNAELGLSHETITQRFGTKSELFRASVAHGLQRFVESVDDQISAAAPTNDLERLRVTVRAFIHATARHPHLGALLHQGHLTEADRLELTSTIGLADHIVGMSELLRSLHAAALIHETSTRELWFLVEAAASPLQFRGLAAMFDPVDGPFDAERHLDRMVDIVIRALLT